MKLAFFDDFKLGVLKGQGIVDVTAAAGDRRRGRPQSLLNTVMENWSEYQPRFENLVNVSEGKPLDMVKFRTPVPTPGKMVCLAGNYMESGTLVKAYDQDAFLKSPESVLADGGTVILPDGPADVFHHEAELAFVCSKNAKDVKAADAEDYIFGYMNFSDVSARGISPEGRNSFFWGKSWDTFGPMGPYLVTADEVPEPNSLDVKLWNNGDLRHDFNTSDMARSVPEVLEWVTSIVTLSVGDIVATGTNHRGLGPLQDGEQVEMEITGLGRLHYSVRDEMKRTWVRETVSQQQEHDGS
jgi:2-keto-4-pentenoate hydratase/2-oxohepta-3-ene-1,7-dioic acid hydratase in catechol pathway